jgi:lipid-A-disaccharide synthase
VLIDYMGPNISWGNLLRQQSKQLPIIYYIAPQEWVWSFGDGNTTQMVGFSDLIQAVFPGEARYYASKGAKVSWVGHPLLDLLAERPSREQARRELGLADDTPAVALFPASRQQELRYLMPAMFEAAARLQQQIPRIEFLVPLSQPRFRAQVAAAIRQYGLQARILEGQSYTIQAAADLAIAKSGTVNLELALQQVPQVVIYRVGRVTAWVAQHVLRFSIPFMSPPNLINMEAVVPELLQDEASAERIYQEAYSLLTDRERLRTVQEGYTRMRSALGEPGVCDRAANEILDLMVERRASNAGAAPGPA